VNRFKSGDPGKKRESPMARTAPVAGRMTERNIRKILASISARLENPSLSNKDFLTLMRHQERLCEEMRLVEISRLETAIAQQEAGRAKRTPDERT
jgi:hypothetical protein